jgi:hypothetical protein
MRIVFTVILFLSIVFGFGQDNDASKEDAKLIKENTSNTNLETEYNQIFTSVDVHAQPTFGMNSFRRYIASSFRLPEVDTTTIGRVITKFTVCEDGSICDIQVVNESPAGLGLGEETKRILNIYGNWKPAFLNNKAVNSYYTLPIAIEITPAEISEPINNENNSTPIKD